MNVLDGLLHFFLTITRLSLDKNSIGAVTAADT